MKLKKGLHDMKVLSWMLSLLFIFCITPRIFADTNRTGKQKLNILLIYTDDHRYSGVHALGKQQLKTPNMDELAREGIAFTNSYLMGSAHGATCIPSRAMLHTGRSLFGLAQKGWLIPPKHATMGEAFGKAGYYTHIIGKWHQDHASLARSFESGSRLMGLGVYLTDHFRMPYHDWNHEGRYPKEDAYLLQYDAEGKAIPRPLNAGDKRGPTGTERDGPHSSEVFADNAVQFIGNYNKEEPFYLYLAFHAPHDPRQAPQEYRDRYPPEEILLPPSYMPQHPFDNGDLVLRDEALAPWPRTPEIARNHLAEYYAIITHLDAQIGRVIDALKESGMYENTLVVLAGDSGLGVGCHGLMGKQNLYDEDGIHVPFIISGEPVREKGKKIEALCQIQDIFPTICDLAKVPVPNSVQGISLRPVIEGGSDQTREYTYHAYKQFQRAFRKGDYKLIEYVRAEASDRQKGVIRKGSRVTQLFNVKEDPWETFNLAGLPEYEELLGSMRAEMKKAALETGDTKENLDIDYDFWQYFDKDGGNP